MVEAVPEGTHFTFHVTYTNFLRAMRAIFVPTRPACSLESPAAYHCGPREHSPPASSSTSVLVFPKWIVITGSLDWAKGSSANDLLEGHLRCG